MLTYEVFNSLNVFWSERPHFEIVLILKYKEEVKQSHDFRPLVFVINFTFKYVLLYNTFYFIVRSISQQVVFSKTPELSNIMAEW